MDRWHQQVSSRESNKKRGRRADKAGSDKDDRKRWRRKVEKENTR